MGEADFEVYCMRTGSLWVNGSRKRVEELLKPNAEETTLDEKKRKLNKRKRELENGKRGLDRSIRRLDSEKVG